VGPVLVKRSFFLFHNLELCLSFLFSDFRSVSYSLGVASGVGIGRDVFRQIIQTESTLKPFRLLPFQSGADASLLRIVSCVKLQSQNDTGGGRS